MEDNLAYQDGWQDVRKRELIGGSVVLLAPASTNHNLTAGNIFALFKWYLKEKKCVPISDGVTVFLSENDHFVPDMMVVCDREKIHHDGIHGAPDLAVEVLSPSTMKNDRTHKKDVYAKCGVREYWLVNPTDRSIEVYRLDDGQFSLHDIYVLCPDWELKQMTDTERSAVVTSFKCGLFPDLEISLDEVFGGLLD